MIDEYSLLKYPQLLRYFEVPTFPSQLHQLNGKSYFVVRPDVKAISSLRFLPELKLTTSVDIVDVQITNSDIITYELVDNSIRIVKYPILKELSKYEFDNLIASVELSK